MRYSERNNGLDIYVYIYDFDKTHLDMAGKSKKRGSLVKSWRGGGGGEREGRGQTLRKMEA